jgi:hypothetical protein
MIKRWILIGLLIFPTVVMAQDAAETQEPDAVVYTFEFPIAAPTDAQIDEAYACTLDMSSDNGSAQQATQEAESTTESSTACDLATELVSMAAERGDTPPSDEEYALFYQLLEANPAMALRLSLIAAYFNTPALVAPPEAALKTITSAHFTYTFSGLGPSNNYDVTITNVDKTPKVTGTVSINGGMMESEATEEPLTLPKTVDAAAVQAFGPATSDLLPIATQFSSVPCWDYYPNWVVELTFDDETTLTLVTNQSNVIGIGGPWQVEIDGQNYMQYSGAFSEAMIGLLEALELPLGETAAMGCGGITDPLYDAFPNPTD